MPECSIADKRNALLDRDVRLSRLPSGLETQGHDIVHKLSDFWSEDGAEASMEAAVMGWIHEDFFAFEPYTNEEAAAGCIAPALFGIRLQSNSALNVLHDKCTRIINMDGGRAGDIDGICFQSSTTADGVSFLLVWNTNADGSRSLLSWADFIAGRFQPLGASACGGNDAPAKSGFQAMQEWVRCQLEHDGEDLANNCVEKIHEWHDSSGLCATRQVPQLYFTNGRRNMLYERLRHCSDKRTWQFGAKVRQSPLDDWSQQLVMFACTEHGQTSTIPINEADNALRSRESWAEMLECDAGGYDDCLRDALHDAHFIGNASQPRVQLVHHPAWPMVDRGNDGIDYMRNVTGDRLQSMTDRVHVKRLVTSNMWHEGGSPSIGNQWAQPTTCSFPMDELGWQWWHAEGTASWMDGELNASPFYGSAWNSSSSYGSERIYWRTRSSHRDALILCADYVKMAKDKKKTTDVQNILKAMPRDEYAFSAVMSALTDNLVELMFDRYGIFVVQAGFNVLMWSEDDPELSMQWETIACDAILKHWDKLILGYLSEITYKNVMWAIEFLYMKSSDRLQEFCQRAYTSGEELANSKYGQLVLQHGLLFTEKALVRSNCTPQREVWESIRSGFFRVAIEALQNKDAWERKTNTASHFINLCLKLLSAKHPNFGYASLLSYRRKIIDIVTLDKPLLRLLCQHGSGRYTGRRIYELASPQDRKKLERIAQSQGERIDTPEVRILEKFHQSLFMPDCDYELELPGLLPR